MKISLSSLLLLLTIVCSAQTSTSDVWLNEFHYDHITTRGNGDSAEFIEIAIKSSIASDPVELGKYSVILYTGGALDAAALSSGRGLPYNTASSWYTAAETIHPLAGFQQCVVNNSSFTLLHKPMPVLQDVPAAIAIVYNNVTVIQLLSYEKQFKIETAARGGGPAAAMTTTLITNELAFPVMETARTPANHSISLLGTGTSYSEFFWSDDPIIMATPCAPNSNTATTQNFSGPLPVRWLSLNARGAKNTIYAEWKVATETGVSKYVIELADVNGNVVTTMEVPFDRNANGSYRVNIPNLQSGMYRVRIKSQMITGSAEFSAARMVRLSDQLLQFVAVYPNPVKGTIANVTIIPSQKTAYTIELVDLSGKRVSNVKTAVLQPGTLNKIELPLNVRPGVYQLKVTSPFDQQTVKVVVL